MWNPVWLEPRVGKVESADLESVVYITSGYVCSQGVKIAGEVNVTQSEGEPALGLVDRREHPTAQECILQAIPVLSNQPASSEWQLPDAVHSKSVGKILSGHPP